MDVPQLCSIRWIIIVCREDTTQISAMINGEHIPPENTIGKSTMIMATGVSMGFPSDAGDAIDTMGISQVDRSSAWGPDPLDLEAQDGLKESLHLAASGSVVSA